MKTSYSTFALCMLSAGLSGQVWAQEVQVDVNPDIVHTVGGIDSMDRQKFITIHSDIGDSEWGGNNEPGDLRKNFLEKYDVYLGRNTGGITYWLNAQLSEDPAKPGFANTTDITRQGNYVKSQYAAKPELFSYQKRNLDQVICAQLHPFWPDGQKTANGWAFSQKSTPDEPFGTATGTYMAQYISQFYGNGGTTGENKPAYVEVINEPLWHLVDFGKEQPARIFDFHNGIAAAIRKILPNIPIGGYCVAFPDLDKNNFREWEDRMKLFMDMSGDKMDFWSIHLYDFPAFQKKQKYRKGSNLEATFDMMEQYSFMKFGQAKPFLVSEYGAQMHDYFKQWSPFRDWLFVKSVNSMMMQFMERPNLMSKAIPFIPLKAEWGREADGTPYNSRLLRQAKELSSQTGDQYVYTEFVKVYQLWSDVKGSRVDSKSNQLDIMTDSYVSGDKLYVILNNLKFQPVPVRINLKQIDAASIKDVEVRHLYLNQQIPVLSVETKTTPPSVLQLGAEATMILTYTFKTAPAMKGRSQETKYYADTYYKTISPGQANIFAFDNVAVETNHEATLRIGVGRDLGLSLKPQVLVNSTPITVPDDFRGDDQTDRGNFFGVLEAPIPAELLKKGRNTVQVTFPDGGGKISSVTMRVFNFSREINRFASTVLATEDEPRVGFQVFPNPTDRQVIVRMAPFTPDTNLSIQTLTGQTVLTRTAAAPETALDVSHLPAGIYIVTVNSTNGIRSKKITIL